MGKYHGEEKCEIEDLRRNATQIGCKQSALGRLFKTLVLIKRLEEAMGYREIPRDILTFEDIMELFSCSCQFCARKFLCVDACKNYCVRESLDKFCSKEACNRFMGYIDTICTCG